MARKDGRLYGKFTHDFADSPKIAPLSDSAFRTLVEMTLWSARMMTDGIIPGGVATKFWQVPALAELCQNDAVNPSLILRSNGDYEIHDFTEHQTTRLEIEAKREAGRLGGIAKAAANAVAPASGSPVAKGKRASSKTLANTEDRSKKDISAPAARIDVSSLFDQFWSAWPLKKGKKEARTAFEKAIKSGATLEQILAGVENYKREIGPSPDWSKVKWPQGWLNGERWDDEPAPKAAANTGYYQARPEAPEGRRYAVDVASGVPLA